MRFVLKGVLSRVDLRASDPVNAGPDAAGRDGFGDDGFGRLAREGVVDARGEGEDSESVRGAIGINTYGNASVIVITRPDGNAMAYTTATEGHSRSRPSPPPPS